MRKTLLLVFIAFACLGCATTGLFSKTGMSAVSFQTESNSLAFHKEPPSKEGKACSHNVLGLVSFGDSGLKEAQHRGRLSGSR